MSWMSLLWPNSSPGIWAKNRAAGWTKNRDQTCDLNEPPIKACASFLAVEKMREGLSSQEACRHVCQRVIDRHAGKPLFGLKIVALSKNGYYGCCSIRGRIDKKTGKVIGLGFSVHDAKGHRTEPGVAILPPMTEEERKSIPWR